MNFRLALALFVGVLVGAIGVSLFLSNRAPGPGPDLKPVLDRLDRLDHEGSRLRGDLIALNRQLLELKATAASAPDPVRAKTAAAEAAVATARDLGVPAPTAQEIVKPQPDDVKHQDDAVVQAVTQMGTAISDKDSQDLNIDKCRKVVADLSDSQKRAKVADAGKTALVDGIGGCQSQLHNESNRLRDDYKKMKCDDHPNTDACQQKHREIKKADDLEKILKILITVVGIYFMMDGDVSTGLLLISMANGIGASGGAGDGEGDGNAQAQGTVNASNVPGTQTTSPDDTKGGLGSSEIAGLGGDIRCVPVDSGMQCTDTKKPSRTALLKPDLTATTAPLNDAEQKAKAALQHAISANDKSILAVCTTDSDGSAFMSGLVIKDADSHFYLIRTVPGSNASGSSDGSLRITYATPETTQPACNIETRK